jgi:UDP-N-acetylglucosamine acyltransferase
MTQRIHSTAIVHPNASLADDVEVGAWSIIGEGVTIGAGCVIGPYTRIEGPTMIGERNRFTSHCSIGAEPQDLKFKGEPTEVVIGNDNIFREFVTVHRGTATGRRITRIASDSFFMTYAHIAHDCDIGSHVIFANAGTLAGHVDIGDHATVGAFSAVHQFCRVGEHAFIGGFTVATQDVLPYVKTVGSRPAKTYGVNTIGLQRKGFSKETVEAIGRVYRILVRSKLRLQDALQRIETEFPDTPEAQYLVDFVRASKRGFIR